MITQSMPDCNQVRSQRNYAKGSTGGAWHTNASWLMGVVLKICTKLEEHSS